MLAQARLVPLLAALGGAVAGIAAAPPVGALAQPPTAVDSAAPVRIVAPRDGALIGAGRLTVVKVRTGPAARGFRAEVGGRSVAGRFASARGGVRVARLRLAPGRQRLVVSVATAGGRRHYAAAHFTVGRHSEPFLALQRGGGSAAAATIRARTAGTATGFVARLNGRPLPRAFQARHGRLRVAQLGASHGLRHGRNRLVVRANHDDGRYDVETVAFRIRGDRPLAGAGPDRRTTVGGGARLDGRASQPTRAGGKLRYRWAIVRAPRGSRARLLAPRSARPRLRPDVHGTYRLRLTVTAADRRATGAPEILRPPQSDTVTVRVQPTPAPIGVPIATIQASGEPGIKVGSTLYRARGADASQCPQGAGPDASFAQVLVLDRNTLECVRQFNFSTSDDPQKLSDAVNATNAGQLVAVTGAGVEHPSLSQKQIDALSYAFKTLGGTLRPFSGGGDHGLRHGSWSLLGSKSLDGPGGEGTASQGQALGDQRPPGGGSLDGYLQVNGEQLYAYTAGAYVRFDTSVPAQPAGVNAIRVGDAVHPSTAGGQAPLAPGQAGFQLLVLDQTTLAPISNDTYVTNEAGGAQRTSGARSLTDLRVRLEQLAAGQRNVLAILASIGRPSGRSSEWASNFAPAARRLGASRDLLAGLDGHGYALVGGTRLPVNDGKHDNALHLGAAGYGDEISDKLTPKLPVRMTGILSRNRQSQFSASGWSPGERFDQSLYEVAYGAASAPWPGADSPGQRAALAYLTRKLGERLPLAPAADLRANYVTDQTAVHWSGRRTDLAQIGYPQTRAPGFTRAELDAVKAQLDTEFEYVAALRSTIDGYQQVYTTSEAPGLVDIRTIAHEIENDIDPPKRAHTGFDMSEIGTALLHFASEAAPEKLLPGAGPALGMLSAVSEIASSIETVGGRPITAVIEEEADKLTQQLVTSVAAQQAGLDQVGDILVSDWGRLRVAGPKSTSDWQLNSAGKNAIKTTLAATARQGYYRALAPIAYSAYDLFPQHGDDPGISDARKYRCRGEGLDTNTYAIFATVPDAAQIPVVAGWHDHYGRANIHPHVMGAEIEKVLDGGGNAVIGRSPKYPSKGTLAKMFTPADEGGSVGLHQLTFFERSLPYHQVRCVQ